MIKYFVEILLSELGTTLAITRVSSGATATAAGMSTRDAQVEAVVNGAIDSDSNIIADGVKAVALNSDVVNTNNGLKQESNGSLSVDPSDTNPCLEISDGGVRVKVDEVINRASGGLTWGRTGDVIFSSNTNTPTGFTDISTTYANKFLRISATALSAGGSDTLSGATDSHVLTTAEIPAHSHVQHSDTYYYTVTAGGPYASNPGLPVQSTKSTNETGGGGGHTHTLSASFTPSYVTLKAYQKS